MPTDDERRIPCFKAGRKLLFDPDAVEQGFLARARDAGVNDGN